MDGAFSGDSRAMCPIKKNERVIYSYLQEAEGRAYNELVRKRRSLVEWVNGRLKVNLCVRASACAACPPARLRDCPDACVLP
jgi:hypothetical protein